MAKKASSKATRAKRVDDFATLWRCLPHPPGSVVRLFARGGDERDGDYARTAREVRTFAEAHPDKNIYVAPNPTCSTMGARHSAKDVTHWSYFLIDMDPVEEKYDAKAALDQALLRIGECIGKNFKKLLPIIIDSGRGMQAWIRLEDQPLLDTLARTTARRVNGFWLKHLDQHLGVVHGCRIDTSVSDLPRVMRCPGTVNVKTGRKATFVNATSHIFTGVAKLLLDGVPEKLLTDPEADPVRPGQSWQMVFSHLTAMAQDYLRRGKSEPGRHKVMWHTAKKFSELGVDRSQARLALQWANSLQGEDEELPADQIEAALKQAYGS